MKIKATLLLIIFSAITAISFAQEKLSITAGFGYPQLPNVGLRLNGKQSQLGISAGFINTRGEKANSFCLDAYYHFGGKSQFTSRKPWFVKAGVNQYYSELKYSTQRNGYFIPAIGREFNISKKFALEVYGGAAFLLQGRVFPNQGSAMTESKPYPVIPTVGFGGFYKIGL